MNPHPHQPDIFSELEALGYEVRLDGQCYSVLNRDGAEVVRLPLGVLDRGGEAAVPGSPDSWISVLPSTILDRD